MNAIVQSLELASEFLTAQQEAFARAFVEYGNASTAYRLAYQVSWNSQPATAWEEASRLRAHPGIAARIDELLAAAAATTIIKARDVLSQHMDVATGDTNEIEQVRSVCCRHCWGAGHAYQWQDAEYAYALQDALDMGVNSEGQPLMRAPSDRGGFGFDPQRAPNPACPADDCRGAGIQIIVRANTSDLSPKARRRYQGVKRTAHGIEMLLADPSEARKEVAKLLGAYQSDGKVGELGLPPAVDGPVDANADPADSYMQMVQRSR